MGDMYMELYEKLSKIQFLLQRYHLQKHAEHGPLGDSTRGQGRVLALLKLQPEISTKDLAYLLGIRQQSLSELLNKLERGGYITRKPSEADKRVVMVQLTEKGKEEQHTDSDFGDIFSCLNDGEQRTFNEYLDRVIMALEKQHGFEPDEETVEWVRSARARMGSEKFERLYSMRRGGRFHNHDPHFGGPGKPHRPHFDGPGKPHDPHFEETDKPSGPHSDGRNNRNE